MTTTAEAIKTARRSVHICRNGPGYAVQNPWYPEQPDGPSTSTTARDYRHALELARICRARVALALLQVPTDALSDAQHDVAMDGADWVQTVRRHARAHRQNLEDQQ